jgi:hypothetical protein
MKRTELACLKSKPELVGRGVYREVYRLGRFAVKVERSRGDLAKLHTRAKKLRSLNLGVRERADFLPEFYGAVLTAERRGGYWIPVAVTFHEFVAPLSLGSLESLRMMIKLIGRAAEQGCVLDLRPSNFGRKGGRVYYLDEYGVGKGPIPPDVFENLSRILGSFIKLGEKVSRSPARLSKRLRRGSQKD